MTKKNGETILGWVNRLIPKDSGTERIVSAHAYGDHPRHVFDAYVPFGFSDPLPMLFFIYGGGWNSGFRLEYEFVGRAFAAAGFITVIAEYRLVPEIRYPVFLEDCGLALTEALKVLPAHGADPSRVFLMGHSAGAYNAVMLGLDGVRFGAPPLGKSLRGVVGLSGPYDFYPFEVKEAIATFSGTPDPEMSQPVNLVTPDAPPVFVGHGSMDRVCGPYNSGNLAIKLRAAGVPVTERYYPGLVHPSTLLALMPLLRRHSPVYWDVVRFMRDLL